MIQSYVNDLNHCTNMDSSYAASGTMPKIEQTNYLMQGAPRDNDWRYFTELIYDKMDTLADKPEEVIMFMKPYEVRLQKKDDSEVAGINSMSRTEVIKVGRFSSPRSRVREEVRVMVVVPRVRSIAAGILIHATHAIR